MLKERRWNFRSRICIGTFLLLFCNVVAEVPATTSEIPQTPDPAKTLLRKIPANEESEFSGKAGSRDEISPVPGQAVKAHNDSVGSEGKADSSREKVAATWLPVDAEKRTTSRSSDEVDKLVTSEPANRKSRLTNSLEENSGKASAGTSVSEKPMKLTRIDEGTNKKANEVTLPEPRDGQNEKKSSGDSGKVGEIVEEDSNKSNVKTSTVRPALREALKALKEPKKKRVEDFDVKESEESDLEDDSREKVKDDNVSLINDTYVNYGLFHKTRPEKNGHSANGTESNVISKGIDVEGKQDPKKDVEIVKDVQRQPSQRLVLQNNITDSGSKTGNQGGNAEQSSEESKQEIQEKKGQSSSEDSDLMSRKSNSSSSSSSSSSSNSSSSESSSSENVDSEEKSSLSSSESGTEKKEPLERNVSTNAFPKGRTIGFSSANEFPNSETKTTEVSEDKTLETLPLGKNVRSEVPFEQRPYPYLKSNKNLTEESSAKVTTEGGKAEKMTDEPAPFENTIGQSQSEKKFVVTEPSVVIENSIQQGKPNQSKSWTNSTVDDGQFVSIVSTTVSPSTTSQKFANQVEPGKSGSSVVDEAQTKDVEDGKTSDAENVVPSGSKEEEKSAVVGKSGDFDVTGNGITEINRKLEESFVNATEASRQNPTVPQGPSTEKTVTSSRLDSSKADVQTDAEESMLIRSSFNVSEGSSEFPLTMNDQTTIFPSTETLTTHDKPVTGTLNSTTMTSRNFVTESLKNLTQRKSTVTLEAMTTLNPDETSIPTSTRIEYEFVGLTDAIVSESEVTESPNTTTPLTTTLRTTVEDSKIQNNVTTESNEITSTVENVTETSSTEESTIKETEGTTVVSEETEQTTVEMTSIEVAESTTSMLTTLEDLSPPVESTTIDTEDRKTTETYVPTSSEFVEKETTMLTTESSSTATTSGTTEYLTTTETTTIPTTESTTTWKLRNTSTVTVTTPSTLTPLTKSVSPSTWSTPGPTERTAEQTTEASSTLSSDEITSLVRIVIEGTWREVCPRLPELRQSLADILSTGTGTDKQVMSRQIVIHQSPCLESSLPTPTPSEEPLTSMLIYVVDESGKFDEEMTKILPSLYYKVSPINFPVTIHSFLLVQEADSGNAIAAVVISSVAFICLLLLAGLLFSARCVAEKLTTMTYRSSFIMRKRQTRFNYGERCRPVSLDAYSLDSVPACNSVRRKGAARSSKRSYGNPTFEDSSVIPSHPLNFAGLSTFCGDVNAITEEFSGVPQVSAKMDELPGGAEVKNRYANVVPLPETRVPLQRIGNDPLSEYINASYVRGPKNATKYYIACQAPMESTVTDFWRMVWEQQSKVIIMLTDLVENGVEKCHEYIPPSEVTDCHRLFGDYQVTLKKRETKEKYAISTLHLKNLENNTFREVYHIWYLWPVSGVQSDGAGLIAVLLEARALQRGGPGPIVVHCSPGTGRTGTLIALDLGIRQYEITRTVDVPRVVYTIRRDRAGAVQTKEQYAFIYKALNLYATKLAGGVLEST